jgi:4-nitrophenyl phosphatase
VSAFADAEAVVFDVDGTLLHAGNPSTSEGAHPIPGAIEAVARVRAGGRRIVFFTNGTGRPPAVAAADLRSVGFTLSDDEYMNPAVVAARWIARKHPGRTVLVLGGAGVVAPLRDRGIPVVDAAGGGTADLVLVGWDDNLTYAALRAACDAVWAGAPLLATSTAAVFSVRGGKAPGWSGAVVAGIRQTTGARAITLGKPSEIALRETCRALGVPPRRTAVVGDDLSLEIAMARRLGSPTALVLTGISSEADARTTRNTPTAVIPDVTFFPGLLGLG